MKYIAPLILILIILIVGMNIYTNYGVHADEANNHRFGNKWLTYVETSLDDKKPVKIDFSNKYSGVINYDFMLIPGQNEKRIFVGEHDLSHGPIIEISIAFLTKKLGFESVLDNILFRHFTTYLFFILAIIFIYILALRLFNSWIYALIASILLILQPRIFGNAFFNTVDIPFLTFFLVSTYTFIRFLDDKRYLNAILHSIACAILIDIRIAGLIMLITTTVFMAIEFIKSKYSLKLIKSYFVYLFVMIMLIIIFWPYLWSNPLLNFIEAFKHSSQMANTGRIFAEVGWYYNLLWIFYTTPVLYSLFFIIGAVFLIICFIKNPVSKYSYYRNHLVILTLVLLSLALPVIFNTRLFHGWRHHYFIYPGFVLIAVFGIYSLTDLCKTRLNTAGTSAVKALITIIILVNSFFVIKYIVGEHPYEYVYVNRFGLENNEYIIKHFPLDYWYLSDKKILDYIADNDKKTELFIISQQRQMGNLYPYILNEEKGLNIKLNTINKNSKKPHYLILINDYENSSKPPGSHYSEYYKLKLNGRVYKTVYKFNNE